jgi:hypothetical protein
MKYTVEGYVDIQHGVTKTEYVITCNELIYEFPRPHRGNICARFHAGNAYAAHLQSDSIEFPSSMLNKDFETDYSIVSEKEIPRGPFDMETPGSPEPQVATSGPEQREAPRGQEQMASKGAN